MNVLVTGIDGFVGSHLAELLLETPGVTLFGLVKSSSATPLIHHLRSRIEFLEGDITDANVVAAVVAASRPERIFHLAGQAFVPHSLRAPDETFLVNINGGVNLLEAVRRQKITSTVLILSSGEVYGSPAQNPLPIDESFPLHPANPYAASKACIDLIAQQYGTSFGMSVIVARPFNHLGPRQSELFVGSAFAKQIAEMKLGRRGNLPRHWVGVGASINRAGTGCGKGIPGCRQTSAEAARGYFSSSKT